MCCHAKNAVQQVYCCLFWPLQFVKFKTAFFHKSSVLHKKSYKKQIELTIFRDCKPSCIFTNVVDILSAKVATTCDKFLAICSIFGSSHFGLLIQKMKESGSGFLVLAN